MTRIAIPRNAATMTRVAAIMQKRAEDAERALREETRVTAMCVQALQPFALSSTSYAKCRDDRPLVYTMRHEEPLTVGNLRAAADALRAANSPSTATIADATPPTPRSRIADWVSCPTSFGAGVGLGALLLTWWK